MPLEQIPLDFEEPGGQENPEENETQEKKVIIQMNEDPSIPTIKDPGGTNLEKRTTRGRMKLSDMKASADLVQIPEDEILFQKSYYSIGAVAEMFNVNQSLIRFWENEFESIKPKKNAKGDRLFRPEDVKALQLIYHLLRDKKYTIEGAKDFLKKNKRADEKFAATESLKRLKLFLLELKANL
jgi:DNA-binding transcriptional MerR regulator